MELRDVETFLVLAEELHFGRTAARVGVSSGRVSQTIQALEREVGGALFERTSRKVRLTPLGGRFQRRARTGYEGLMRALEESRSATHEIGGPLRVGYLPEMGSAFVAEMASALEKRHPACTVTPTTVEYALTPGRTPAEGPLLDGDADVVLFWSPRGDGADLSAPGLTAGPALARVPCAVLAPADHPLAAKASVRRDELAGHEILTAPDVARLTGRNTISAHDLQTLVARGRGLHCTTADLLEWLPYPGLTVIRVTDMPPMAIVPVWRTAAESATIRAFVTAARGTAERAPAGAVSA